MLADLHVHTRHSVDSEATMVEQIEAALSRGLDILCFTDHIDFSVRNEGRGGNDAGAFFTEFEAAKAQYSGQIKLLAGFEFSEPHRYPKRFAEYAALPYDFTLGSVHFWHGDYFPSEMPGLDLSIEESFAKYWEAVLEMAEFGGFDSLAHIDFPKRYYGRAVYDEDMLTRILRTIIKKEISLEINTSSLRKGMAEAMPGAYILDLYRSLGGRDVTIGSDAHIPEDVGVGLADFYKLPGVQPVYYENRQKINIP